MSGALVLEDVTITRGGEPLIERLDLTIAPGAVTTVMGPSGVGKSTLLAFVAGFLDRSAFAARGRVRIGDEEVNGLPPERRRIGLLFQDDLLFPHLSVAGNLAFGLTPAIRGRAARRERVEAALAEAGLEGLGERDPASLSGGQRARVALLRVLMSQPRALLLDEPFAKLDAERRARMRETVFAATRAHGLPVLQASHDEADAPEAIIELKPPIALTER